MAANNFSIIRDTLTPGLHRFPDKLDAAVHATMQYYAPQVASYARDNAPWTDRTANARTGLDAKAYGDSKRRGIVLYHQVPYGIWLEVRWSGRYRIIIPTIQTMGDRIMGSLSKIVRRLT